jgi:hypothetical protein
VPHLHRHEWLEEREMLRRRSLINAGVRVSARTCITPSVWRDDGEGLLRTP